MISSSSGCRLPLVTTCIDSPSYENFHNVLLLGEADYSFTRAFATRCSLDSSISKGQNIQITATEYGDGVDIMNRYFNHSDISSSLSETMNSLLRFESVVDVICNLNARHLGEMDGRKMIRDINDQNTKSNESFVCTCQRWNTNHNEWDDPSPFWKDDGKDKYDLVIFNFPHSDQAGRATRLVKALFKQIRLCIDQGKFASNVVLEMRLRTIEINPEKKKNIRSLYNHEEAATESGFVCIGCWPGDLQRWEKFGYQHKMTKKNETCRDINNDCKVWRWKSK